MLNVNVNRTHIEISHKLKCHGNNSSLIIVKFLSHKVKTRLYKERVKLRHVLFCHLHRNFHRNGQGGDHEELLQANGPHARTRENVEKLSSGSAFRIVVFRGTSTSIAPLDAEVLRVIWPEVQSNTHQWNREQTNKALERCL